MDTTHSIVIGDARSMSSIEDDTVELVVTSPPYPMIEMWDEQFSEMNPKISKTLEKGEGWESFELMHLELDKVWRELKRVLKPGGMACINIGDATRKIGGEFRLFPNHSRILESFVDIGFSSLPNILWRKPTNSAAKFMGSGTMPPNAYVTLEHEYILILRNGKRRTSFENGGRHESSYFWEERNQWFTDLWENIKGVSQELSEDTVRERSAAFPLKIPYRLINMYSIYGDTVLDPFWGTGTTTAAAMASARNSIGIEIDQSFEPIFKQRANSIKRTTEEIVEKRLEQHKEFVNSTSRDFKYFSDIYDFPVVTKPEKGMELYTVDKVVSEDSQYRLQHSLFTL